MIGATEGSRVMHCYIWEYDVKPERLAEFEAGYGGQGEWARFFRRDAAYLRTELIRDCNDPNRFITIDYWQSREACRSFRERHRAEFDTIDSKFEALTLAERHLGEFEVQESP